jgi:putative transposase
MGRKQLIRTNEFPYHVTIRTNNKEWFDIPIEKVWRLCLYCLTKACEKIPVEIESFVLMSNHYHLLIYTPNADLDKFMQHFNTYLSKEIRTITRRINRIFGDRYKWQLITKENYYKRATRYIFQNPLRQGIVSKCEDYPFSTLYYQTHNNFFPLSLPPEFATTEYLEYFNQKDENEEEIDLVKVGER